MNTMSDKLSLTSRRSPAATGGSSCSISPAHARIFAATPSGAVTETPYTQTTRVPDLEPRSRLLSVAKNSRHESRISAAMKHRQYPKRLLGRRVGDKVLIAHDMES